MRTIILKRVWRVFGRANFVPQSRGAIVMAALLLAATNLFATATVSLLSGGPHPQHNIASAGFVNGDITTNAEYNTPCGIAVDLSGNYLFVADGGSTNNAVRLLEFDINWAGTLLTLSTNGLNLATNLFNHPVGVAIDSSYNLFVLNRGNGNNGNVLQFTIDEDLFATLVATNAANLTNAAGLAIDFYDNIYVTIKSNTVLQLTPAGGSNIVATIPNAGANLQGLVVKYNGMLAVCDSGRNGIYIINPTNGVVSTNSGFNGAGDFINVMNNRDPITIARFSQPSGVAEMGDGNLIVTDTGNHRVKVVTGTSVTNLYGCQSNYWYAPYLGLTVGNGTVAVPDNNYNDVQSRLPFGVVIAPNGSVYVTEKYWSVIRKVTDNIKPPPSPPSPPPKNLIATPWYGQIYLTWDPSPAATNYNVKHALSSGGPYTIIVSTADTSYTDTNVVDGSTNYYVVSALSTGSESANSAEVSATPMFSPPPTILLPVTNYNFGPVILTWTTSPGATSYNVKRSTSTGGPYINIVNTAGTSYNDSGASASPGTTFFYVVSALNGGGENPTNSVEVSYTVPYPPPPPPQIGWFDYEVNGLYAFSTIHPVSIYPTHNDISIAVDPTANSITTNTLFTADSSIPSVGNGSAKTPPLYVNDSTAWFDSLIPDYVTQMPDMVIKAANFGPGGRSEVVTAEFLFEVANPTILGNNAAQFQINDITTNATIWYTTDGSVPTNNAIPPSTSTAVVITNCIPVTLSLTMTTGNIIFQAQAYRPGYSPSGIYSNSFTAANYVPNTISFGFAAGEASSAFVASPGQTFYAPVTLTILPGTVMDSLQFNLTVTNAGPSPGPAISPGAFDFQSMLMKPNLDDPPYLMVIPPLMFIGYAVDPPPLSQIVTYNHTNFISLLTYDTPLNLLGVGWLELQGKTNLFNTAAQNLITMSEAHDDLFPNAEQPNGVIVGGYSFTVPANAAPGNTYQIQIGRPSATINGIGNPGSSVYIYAPTNGSMGGGIINALKNVTIGQRKYIAGDSAPFRWFNAGDFGDTNLDASDVAQVFEEAVYQLGLNVYNTDLYDSMDSCGYTYVDNGYGYLQSSGIPPLPDENILWNGNDTTIDLLAFGDGTLDVADVYVTYRRSVDPARVWFRRFWTNDVAHGYSGRVAEIVPNVFNPSVVSKASSVVSKTTQSAGNTSVTNQPKVNFVAGDFLAIAGKTIQVPITASIFGNYPLRVLMLNLTVVPLDGSPALTTPVSFSCNPALGSPYMTEQRGNGNYSAVWLDSTITGLSGNNVSIGTLTIAIPTNATSSSAYAVHFDHASASPNGIASFPKQTLTGLITLSSRTNSYYNDGIPDSWRLRYFGTIYNYLSVSNADADGDGMNNWQEYVAGTDPTDPKSCLPLTAAQAQSQTRSINWPSVTGKTYIIQRSTLLFPAHWTSVSTNAGTGTTMEYDDSTGGNVYVYRVQVQ